MFASFILIVVAELLMFGGVLRESWLGALLFAIAVIAITLAKQIATGKVDVRFVLAVLAIFALSLLAGLRFTPPLLVGVWMWYACKKAPGRVLRLLHALLIIGALEALLGLYQHSVEPGWIFGYHNVFNRVSGTLINHDHYAGLLELLIFIPIGLAYTQWVRHQTALAYLYMLAAALMGLALVFSVSRMGMASFVFGLSTIIVLIKLRGVERTLPRSVGLGFVAAIAAAAMWIGMDSVIQRYGELIGPEQRQMAEGRPALYRDTLRMIAAHPWGVGPEKYQDIFRTYQRYDGNVLFDHAHNDYLETAAEWGVLPALLFWALIFAAVVRTARLFFVSELKAERGMLLACIGSIVALMIHGLADFNLQIPVNATLFFAFVGIALAFPLNVSFENSSPEYWNIE